MYKLLLHAAAIVMAQGQEREEGTAETENELVQHTTRGQKVGQGGKQSMFFFSHFRKSDKNYN